MGDVAVALGLGRPWPEVLDGYLDATLFLKLVGFFQKGGDGRRLSSGSLTGIRVARLARTLMGRLQLASDSPTEQVEKLQAILKEDEIRVEGTILACAGYEAMTMDEDQEDDSDENSQLSSGFESTPKDDDVRLGEEDTSTNDMNALYEHISSLTRDDGIVLKFNEDSSSRQLSRAAFYMHHITAEWKKRAIVQVASRAGLTGICLFGKPGRILVEGPESLVQMYVKQIRSWPWKICSLQGPWTIEDRAFKDFKELRSASEFKTSVAQAGLSEELRGVRSES